MQQLSEAERAVLGPLAEHRFLIVPQLAILTGGGEPAVRRRLKLLENRGLVAQRRIFSAQPAAAWVTRAGLRALDSGLRAPSLNLNEYRHEVGVGWLWLAARAGRFGELATPATATSPVTPASPLAPLPLATERDMVAADAAARAAAVGGGIQVPYGIGLGTFGPHGRPQRHYPDLMLEMATGNRVAVELELSQKSRGALQRVMLAYATDARIDAVLYVAGSPKLAAVVREAAHSAGIAQRVHVQLLAADGIAGAPEQPLRVAARATPARAAMRSAPAAGVGR